jgi:outer membrane protein TolC
MWYEDQKIKVITSYVDAQRVMNQLTVFEEAYEYARAQFRLVENDFIVGKITAGELSVSKTLHMQANTNLENARADLKIAILKLETLTNTKIFKK